MRILPTISPLSRNLDLFVTILLCTFAFSSEFMPFFIIVLEQILNLPSGGFLIGKLRFSSGLALYQRIFSKRGAEP
jgi:hypothetical protein